MVVSASKMSLLPNNATDKLNKQLVLDFESTEHFHLTAVATALRCIGDHASMYVCVCVYANDDVVRLQNGNVNVGTNTFRKRNHSSCESIQNDKRDGNFDTHSYQCYLVSIKGKNCIKKTFRNSIRK